MKAFNIRVILKTVIPANAGISKVAMEGDSCLRRNDRNKEFSFRLLRRNDKKELIESQLSIK
ncbi:MAG: hypothetical protein NT007_16670 [Candidatus Kapabacteria bacterium]|nr:hypothetical protein [Candidatus Kapabacteria bacterium]